MGANGLLKVKTITEIGVYTAIQVTLPNGTTYIPMTKVKNPAQAVAFSAATGTKIIEGQSVAIPVPPGVDPESQVSYWASQANLPPDQKSGAFIGYWIPYGPHDYKRLQSLGTYRAMYDAYGNFMYGATGNAVGYSLDTLLGMANILSGGLNYAINSSILPTGSMQLPIEEL